jgi:hypothetical protein
VARVNTSGPGSRLFLGLGGARQVTDLRHVITGGWQIRFGGHAILVGSRPKEMQAQLIGRHTSVANACLRTVFCVAIIYS